LPVAGVTDLALRALRRNVGDNSRVSSANQLNSLKVAHAAPRCPPAQVTYLSRSLARAIRRPCVNLPDTRPHQRMLLSSVCTTDRSTQGMYIARHLGFSTQSFEGRTSALFTSGEALTFSDERRRNTWRPSRLADERRSIIRECTLPPPAEDPKDGSAASACAARTPTCHPLAI
jgi:hypothetical protein